MNTPHSHRGQPLDEQQEASLEPHTPAHIAIDDSEVEDPEEQPA